MANKKYVYQFKDSHGLGKELLGGKGAGLAEMTYVGIPIPPGFTVSTEACNLYYNSGKKLPKNVVDEILNAVEVLEKDTGKKLGGKKNPLLLSVRSGARVSMPGMMDTILNLGLNDDTAKTMVEETNNPRFVADCYRRFILMYTNVVKGKSREAMDKMLDDLKKAKGAKLDTDLTAEDLNKLVKDYKAYYLKVVGEPFPHDPKVQLLEAVTAVFRSWDNERANIYRKMHHIPYEWGTAVNVQTMVFGNKGETSGTGVAFTRSPATGDNHVFAEYLPNAQGEDVVAGIRTPLHIDWLEENMPEVYRQFAETIDKMEHYYKDMQDIEFTVEDGVLYFLQTRSGKRTAQAALKIACDLLDEGTINEEEALLLIDPSSLTTLLLPSFDESELKKVTPIADGLPASPGAATGKLVFDADEAAKRHAAGETVILVRQETSPEDLAGMVAAEGILTMRGGMTSHAAVVARGMGKCCIVGANAIQVDEKAHTMKVGNKTYSTNDVISINGSTGLVYEGEIKKVEPQMTGNFGRVMKLADKHRRLGIRTNADAPAEAKQAKAFGAEGIGLCRTEHMFFDADRIFHVRKMILSDNVKDREDSLNAILPHQENDFYELFLAMDGLPVTVRLLDPPLHEFLPQEEHLIVDLAKALKTDVKDLKARINALHEFNPMMGHRGVRLTITYPEICRMQTSAIINAALRAQKKLGKSIDAEIMVPLIFGAEELRFVKAVIKETADKLIKESGQKLEYHVGTMMEIPRACLLADEVAKEAAFFSFGTNDLTQMSFGFSRDDATKFLPDYYETRILQQDPFATIDQKGVGQLVRKAVKDGKAANKKLLVGICGEHGGDPRSIEFFDAAGLDYVSCSPFRVPVARLAAAHAAIKHKK